MPARVGTTAPGRSRRRGRRPRSRRPARTRRGVRGRRRVQRTDSVNSANCRRTGPSGLWVTRGEGRRRRPAGDVASRMRAQRARSRWRLGRTPRRRPPSIVREVRARTGCRNAASRSGRPPQPTVTSLERQRCKPLRPNIRDPSPDATVSPSPGQGAVVQSRCVLPSLRERAGPLIGDRGVRKRSATDRRMGRRHSARTSNTDALILGTCKMFDGRRSAGAMGDPADRPEGSEWRDRPCQ
jgi:hypothetical protein